MVDAVEQKSITDRLLSEMKNAFAANSWKGARMPNNFTNQRVDNGSDGTFDSPNEPGTYSITSDTGTYPIEFGDDVTLVENGFGVSGYQYEGAVNEFAGFAVIDGSGNTFVLSDSVIPDGPYTLNPSTDLTCFAAGTLIATPEGETIVESLQIGDLINTSDGRAVLVKWIGRQTVHKLFTQPERFVPVRVSAGALGDGLPHTDLVLTADHALIIDDLAINASALVNGTTIAYESIDSQPERVTYYHIETEDHDVILANGAPAETFVDYVGRKAFDNFAEYLGLYGDEQAITEMSRPRVSAARLLPPSVRTRLARQDAA